MHPSRRRHLQLTTLDVNAFYPDDGEDSLAARMGGPTAARDGGGAGDAPADGAVHGAAGGVAGPFMTEKDGPQLQWSAPSGVAHA